MLGNFDNSSIECDKKDFLAVTRRLIGKITHSNAN